MIRYVLALIIGLTCAVPAQADDVQEYQQYSVAEAAFKKGDYEQAFRLLIPLADDGVDPFVQRWTWHMLGEMFQNGWGVEKSGEEALFWYKKAAGPGDMHTRSLEKIARIYIEGDGVPRDYVAAAEWYERAALGSDDAKYVLGWLYRRGLGVPRSDRLALYYLRQAAGCSNFARVELGDMYLTGAGVRKSLRSALIWYRRAAEANTNDGRIEWAIGSTYLDGILVRKDYGQALIWLQRSAAHGFFRAHAQLGRIYAEGKGVKRDYLKALVLARKGAERGDDAAFYLLGRLYERGRGVEKNDAEALSYYLKAAEAGSRSAPARIATFYRLGRGVEKNLVEARVWLRKDKALPAPLKEKDYAAPPDRETLSFGDERALKIRQRAERGDPAAQRKLGLIYAECQCSAGRNDYEQARLWLSRAARHGDRKAKQALARLAGMGERSEKNENGER